MYECAVGYVNALIYVYKDLYMYILLIISDFLCEVREGVRECVGQNSEATTGAAF